MNILTFDIEEWFHLLDFDATRSEKQWDNYEVRIYENVDRILNMLDETNSKATFFIIGWVAKKYPDLIRKIAMKYEIASHTMNHQLVWQQSKEEFKRDVECSVKLLQDVTGKEVVSFRAPGFSIRESEKWAFEILHELGITRDCSVFPAKHSHGGMPSVHHAAPCLIKYNGISMKEFPITIKKIYGVNLAFSGGGYFRLFPYWIIKKWAKDTPEYLMSYIHPRDLDYGQPVLKELSLSRKFKSYVGLKSAESKLLRMMSDNNFIDLETADKQLNWDNVPSLVL